MFTKLGRKEEEKKKQLQIPCPTSSPRLVYTHSKCKQGQLKNTQTISTLSSYIIDSIPALQGKRIVSSSSLGWYLLRGFKNTSKQFYLWEPTTSNLIHLPPLNNPDFSPKMNVTTCILTSNPNTNNCCILLIFSNSFVFAYTLNTPPHMLGNTWMSQRVLLKGVAANVKQAIITSNGVIYGLLQTDGPRGTIIYYLVSLKLTTGKKAWDTNNNMSLKCGPIKLPLPSHDNCLSPRCDILHRFLVESCGLVYLVVATILLHKSCPHIVGINIWQLDLGTTTWVEVESIGDRAFFLDLNNGSTWCWAHSQDGIHPNSIYFILPNVQDNVYLYTINDRTLTSFTPCPNLLKPRDLPTWVNMPHHHLRPSIETLLGKLEVPISINGPEGFDKLLDQNRTQKDLISSLPEEVISLILDRLHWFDYLSLRQACKSFRKRLPLPECKPHNSLPLFLFSKSDGGLCQIMDPYRNDSRFNSLPFPPKFKRFIDYSNKKGWVVFTTNRYKRLKYLNLFTGESGKFPCCKDLQEWSIASIAFSTCPTSTDCWTVGIDAGWDSVSIAYHLYGQQTWEVAEFKDENINFLAGSCSPVFVDGKFYILDQKGNLGVLQWEQGELNMRFYGKPKLKTRHYWSNHLAECDGQILAVFIGEMGRWVQVLRFSDSEEKWREVKELRNKNLFISHTTSFSAASDGETKNRIYLPRFYDNEIVYYSLETNMFHTAAGQHCFSDLHATAQPLRCCWV